MNVCVGAGVPLPGGRQGEHVPAPRPPGGHQPDPLLKYQVHSVMWIRIDCIRIRKI